MRVTKNDEIYRMVSETLRGYGMNHIIVNFGAEVGVYLPLMYYQMPDIIVISIRENGECIITGEAHDHDTMSMLLGNQKPINTDIFDTFVPTDGVFKIYSRDYISGTKFPSVERLLETIADHIASEKIVTVR